MDVFIIKGMGSFIIIGMGVFIIRVWGAGVGFGIRDLQKWDWAGLDWAGKFSWKKCGAEF